MAIDFTNIMSNKHDYLDADEVDAMLSYCYEADRIRDYMLILTLFRSGRRIVEVTGDKPYNRKVGLRPCDIHPEGLIEFDILKKNHIKSKNKAGKERSPDIVLKERLNKMPKRALIPVDSEYLSLLKDYISMNGIPSHERVFAITDRRARDIIYDVARKVNITRPKGKIHPHTFRHSYAIYLIKKNPNDAQTLQNVQQLLQHSDVRITMEYARFAQEDIKQKLDKTFIGDPDG